MHPSTHIEARFTRGEETRELTSIGDVTPPKTEKIVVLENLGEILRFWGERIRFYGIEIHHLPKLSSQQFGYEDFLGWTFLQAPGTTANL